MRYYAARQRRSDKRWDYTVLIDGLVFPIGYCAGLPDLHSDMIVNELGGEGSVALAEYRGLIERHRQNYHANGHATRAEAKVCYRQYLLDTATKLNVSIHNAQHRCMVCGVWTQGIALVGHQHFTLCDVHRTRDELERLMSGISDHWES